MENVPEHLQNDLLLQEQEPVEDDNGWEDRDEDDMFTPIQLWSKDKWSDMLGKKPSYPNDFTSEQEQETDETTH